MASQRFLLELCVCVCAVLAVDGTRFASQKGAAYPDVCAGVANHVMSAVDRLRGVTLDVEDRLNKMEATNEETSTRLTRIEAVNEETNNRLTRIEAVNEESKKALARLEEKLDIITGMLAATPSVKELKETNVISDKCKRGMANVTREPRIIVTVLDNIPAVCDTQSDGGGWIIFQRRTNGKENFYRPWKDYETGFGDVEGGGDYWLGLQYIHQITSKGNCELLIDMERENLKFNAQYSSFYVGNLFTRYTLSVGGYTGNATDQLIYHNNHNFSTYDKDNDASSERNCAKVYKGAWWYVTCINSNLNGLWRDTSTKGLWWNRIGAVSFTEMKLRLVN